MFGFGGNGEEMPFDPTKRKTMETAAKATAGAGAAAIGIGAAVKGTEAGPFPDQEKI